MTTFILISTTILALIGSLLVIPQVIKLVNKKGLLAQPNHRTSHITPTPSLGGIGIFFGLIAVLPFLDFSLEIIALLIGSTALFIAGLWDDVYDMKSKTKFLIQIACAVGLYFSGFAIDNLYGFLGINEISGVFSFTLTLVFIVGVTNAFNLIDGINGLAGSITLINSLIFGIIFLINNQISFALIAFALCGSILGFLKFNFNPAKIFMGDTGSLFLGLIMSAFTIKVLQADVNMGTNIPLVAALIFLPVFDTLRVFSQRIMNGKSPFEADKNHLHHLVLNVSPLHHKATTILGVLHLSILGIAIATSAFHILSTILLMISAVITFFIALKLLQAKVPLINKAKA